MKKTSKYNTMGINMQRVVKAMQEQAAQWDFDEEFTEEVDEETAEFFPRHTTTSRVETPADELAQLRAENEALKAKVEELRESNRTLFRMCETSTKQEADGLRYRLAKDLKLEVRDFLDVMHDPSYPTKERIEVYEDIFTQIMKRMEHHSIKPMAV